MCGDLACALQMMRVPICTTLWPAARGVLLAGAAGTTLVLNGINRNVCTPGDIAKRLLTAFAFGWPPSDSLIPGEIWRLRSSWTGNRTK